MSELGLWAAIAISVRPLKMTLLLAGTRQVRYWQTGVMISNTNTGSASAPGASVADHQQLKSAICAVAISSTRKR
jgi:hypothetical protein